MERGALPAAGGAAAEREWRARAVGETLLLACACAWFLAHREGCTKSQRTARLLCLLLHASCPQLLLAGLRALKPGGRLVYSTCSLLELENDGVVAAALHAWDSEALRLVPPAEWSVDACLRALAGAEETQHGLIVLPDAAGWGPVYVAVLEKAAA